MFKIFNKKIILLISVFFALFILVIFINISKAQFQGPSCSPPNCQGKIGVDSNNNISIGTSTPQSGTRSLIISQTSDATTYGLKILSSNNSPLLWVRSDGKVSIATSSVYSNYALTVQGDVYVSGNILAAGSSGLSTPAGNVTPGVFNSLQGSSTGAYAFLGNLGVATGSTAGLPQTLSVYGGGYFANNLGVGTTTPGARLHLRGTQGNLAINTESVSNAGIL
jgi:hypothetical protein